MNAKWMQQVVHVIPHLTIMKRCLAKEKYLRTKFETIYTTSIFKRPYHIIIALIERLYDFQDANLFQEKWIPLVLDVVMKGRILNWSILLSLN